MCEISLGTGSDVLTLRIYGRAKPDATDYWQANWLRCTADASIGTFRGTAEWQLRNEDLARFLHALENLKASSGEAVLDTGDGWLDVRIVKDQQGQIQARCQLVDNPAGGNSLEFRLSLDPKSLPALMSNLREVLERFPIIGG